MTFSSAIPPRGVRILRRHRALEAVMLLLFTCLMLQSATAVAPDWWSSQQVLKPGAAADDYALLNLGQLKNLAKKAAAAMGPRLPGGAGNAVGALLAAWEAAPAAGVARDDYTVVNLGQLKAVAKPFYDQLSAAGLRTAGSYPWAGGAAADDYALANIGQMKALFAFDFVIYAANDTNHNGLPDDWEMRYFGNLDHSPGEDFDGDSLTNLQEWLAGTDPSSPAGGGGIDPPLYDPDETPHFITTSLPDGAVNSGYNAGIAVSGGTAPYQFSLTSGAPPDGVYLGTDGTLAGTPTTAMYSSFVVQVTDSTGLTVQQSFTLNVFSGGNGDPPPATDFPLQILTTNSQLNSTVGVPFAVTLAANGGNGGPYTFALEKSDPDESWPEWLKIADGGVTVQGTPSVYGAYHAKIRVTCAAATYNNVVQDALFTASYPLVITTDAALPGSDILNSYSQQIEATGGYGQLTFSVDGGLPPGYGLSPDGMLTGPAFSGPAYVFSVRVADEAGHVKNQSFTLVGAPIPPPPLRIMASGLQGAVGIPYSGSVSASGGDGHYTFSGGGGGLSINPDGSIVGMPVLAGTFGVGVSVTDSSGGSASETLAFVVAEGAPELKISTDSAPTYTAKGGDGDYRWIFSLDPSEYSPPYPGFYFLDCSPPGAAWSAVGASATVNIPPDSTAEETEDVTFTGTVSLSDGTTNTVSVPFSWTVTCMAKKGDAPPTPPAESYGGFGLSKPTKQQPTDDPNESHDLHTSDGTGSRYRKVGLNGVPMPDSKPQVKDESGEVPEETYIDAYSSELRHGVTDVYVSSDSSLLPLSVRRDVTDEIWNENFGLVPYQRADRPFGAGWTSNLCATIRLDNNGFQATVIDEQGASHSFYRVKTDTSDYWVAAKEAHGDYQSRNNTLQYFGADPQKGGSFVYSKVFGTQCTYEFGSNRTNGYNTGTELVQYYRLKTAKDRLQNTLVYTYPGPQALVPQSISDPDRPGNTIYITQDFSRGVITRVTGPGGDAIDYGYTAEEVGDTRPTTVQKLTSVTRAAVGSTPATTVQYGYNVWKETDDEYTLIPGPCSWHAGVNKITDELDRSYIFGLQENRITKYIEISDQIETTYMKRAVPRMVSSVTLPSGEVTTFNVEREAVVRRIMTGDSYSQTTVNGPAGSTVYRFTTPCVEENRPPSDDLVDVTTTRRYYDTTLSFQQMDVTTAAGTETYIYSVNAGMALASSKDVSGNTTTFTYEGNYGDPVRETDALGNFKDYTYDPTSRVMSSMTDQTGVKTLYEIQPITGLKLSETVTTVGGVIKRHSTYQYGNSTFRGFMTQSTVDADAGDPAPPTVTTYALGSGQYGWMQVTETTQTASGPIISSTLKNAAGSKISTTDPRGKTTTFDYDGHHRLVRVNHPGGTHKDLAYDAHGNLIRETNENGIATFHEYDDLNRRIKSTVDLNGNGSADPAYTTATTSGSAVTYDGDIVTSTTYNGRNQVLTQTDARGKVTTHTYDAAGRVTETDDGGLVTTRVYGANSGGGVFDSSGFKPTQVTDPRGAVTTFTYDAMYRTTEQTVSADGISATTCTRYDAAGRPIRVTDALGRVTLTVYDVFGQIVQVTHPDGTMVSTDYTHHDKPWKVVDEMGRLTKTEFDEAGRAVRGISPAVNGVSAITQTSYDAAGNAIAVTDPLGRVTNTSYDDLNRPVQVLAPSVWDAQVGAYARPSSQTTYDAMGQVLTVTDPQGRVTTNLYDRAGRSWKVIAPAVGGVSPATVTHLDPGGLALDVTNPLGQTISNSYDIHGRLTQTVDAAGIANSFTYDAAGNRTSVTDGSNQTTTFEYDGFNRLTRQVFANNDTWTYAYDKVRKISQTSPRGITTTYAYDVRDRVVGTSAPGLSRTHAYDASGHLLSVTEAGNAAATVGYTYDELGRVVAETSRGVQHSYSYDLAGNRILASYGTGRSVVTTYDALNRPLTLVEGGRTTSYGYDLGGRALMLQAGNGQSTRNVYDALGRLTARTLYRSPAMGAGDVLTQFEWTHDLLGNVTNQSETWPGEPTRPGTRSTSMAYDANNRLTGETVTDPTAGVTTTAYAYDAANNRVSKQVTGGADPGVWGYSYNNANQLTHWEQWDSEGGTMLKSAELAYDSSGNRISQTVNDVGGASGNGINPPPAANGLTTYQWDAQDRLSSVTMPDGTQHAYDYDYRTRRIGVRKLMSSVQQAMTAIVFAGGLSLAEFDSTTDTLPAAPTVEYTRGPDMGGGVGGMLYSLRGGSAKYSLSNGRGDIVAQADQSAALTWTASYEAYGRRTKETGSNQDKQRGNSKDEDPTGLLNEGFRYRDLETGVWLSRDPAGFVDGPNVYAYVQQNPWTKFDPEGLSWEDVGDYFSEVGEMWKGYGDAAVEMAKGVGQVIAHPIDTATNIAKAVGSPVETAKAVVSQYSEKWESGTRGKGEIIGEALLSIASGGATKALAETATVAKIVDKIADVSEVAGKAANVVRRMAGGKGPDAPEVPTIACFTAGTLVASADRSVPIESLQVGDRVLTTDDGNQHHETEVDPQTWKKVTLAMVNEECRWDVLDLVVIRSPEWLQETHCLNGGRIWFVLDEIGLEGWATVKQIEPCPKIKPGHGRVVLSTLTHYNGDVYQVRLDGSDEVLEPTGRHRLFSATRNDWVRTETFTEGEQLKTRDGIRTIVSIDRRPGIHRVYNVEVETEHCYYVGSQQVLSHNQNGCAAKSATSNRVKPRKGTLEGVDANQPRNAAGEMVDPYSGQPLKVGEIDLGHKKGQEWKTRRAMHETNGSTRKEVIEAENDPNLYHWEDRSSNRSHKHEQK